MLLENKNAVVYGAGGNVGGSVARAFAREGAKVFLTGRTRAPLEVVAGEIVDSGGLAEVAQVDALDREQVEAHAATMAAAGGIDVSFNAVWIRGDLQGKPLLEMGLDDFTTPITVAATTCFVTSTAVARHMVERGSGVIPMLSTSAARLSGRDERFTRRAGSGSRAAPSRRSRGCLLERLGRAGFACCACDRKRSRRPGGSMARWRRRRTAGS